MNDRDRLEQLRTMLARLERMPASADRDWLLGEVRARTVDVDTGVPPAPMRPPHQNEAEFEIAAGDRSTPNATAAASRPKTGRRKASRRLDRRGAGDPPRATVVHPASPPSPVAASARAPLAGRDGALDLLKQGGLLCLDEPPAAAAGPARPWSRGLRG
jgi:hypothetical protein